MIFRGQFIVPLLLASLIAEPTLGQASATEGTTAELQEVIVSARKRDERLQDVPLTITAVTSDTIAAAGISNVAQLSSLTPGFHYEKEGSRQISQPRIRGMEINTANPTRQNASFFIDGVYMPGSIQSLDFSEFERVEVIKGPQSALFGRQTFGGAVNFVSKAPRNELEADASATLGSNYLREYSGSLSGAMIEDKLFGRVHIRSYNYGGKFRNALDGARLGEEESLSGSAVLTWMPTDAMRFDLRYTRQEDDDSLTPFLMVGAADLNCGPFFTGGFRFYCGAIPTTGQPALNTVVGPNALGIKEFGFDRTGEMLSLKSAFHLAGHELSFTMAKYDEHNSAVNDLDFTGVPAAASATLQDFDNKSLELKLVSDGTQRLNYVAGLYWYDGRFDERVFSRAANLTDFPATLEPDRVDTENVAAFASLSYALTDRLNASAEVRYQQEKITNTGGQGATRRELSATTNAWLPRVIIDFKATPDLMIYGVYSEGNKPQQFNANIAGLPQAQRDYIQTTYGVGIALDEETLKNYEIGVKSSWLDRRATVNLAAFFMQWNDQVTRRQVFRSPTDLTQYNVVDNAGSTEIKGLELESHFAATEALKLDATFAYINAEYTDFNSVNVQQVFGDPQAAGKVAARFPKIQGSFAVSYTMSLPNDWDGTLRLDESYMGKRYSDEVNLAYADSFWRTNVRATAAKGPFTGTLYVENLTDDDGLLMVTRFRDITVPGNNFSFPYLRSEGRKFGLTLRYKY
ncbi:MAG: TonB-dependent receptor [Pseudomonadales bacterium]|nr:TonB-dependent receptor [Pseudomonadales bacterium]